MDEAAIQPAHAAHRHVCPEYGPKVRIWPVGNYVALYQPRKGGIDIVQIAHGARDLPAIVRRLPDLH